MSYINVLTIADAAPAAAPAPAPVSGTQQPASPETPAADAAPAGGGMMQTLLFIVPVFLILYFVMIRPQKKYQKEMKERQDSITVGDKVISNAGLHGIVREVQDKTFKIELAPNMIVKIEKTCIVNKVAKDGSAETK